MEFVLKKPIQEKIRVDFWQNKVSGLREGVKKQKFYFFWKEKKMQNVLNRQKYVFWWKNSRNRNMFILTCLYLRLTILDLLICISKNDKKKILLQKSAKNGFCRTGGGGGLRTLGTGRQLVFLLTPSLREDTHKKKMFF